MLEQIHCELCRKETVHELVQTVRQSPRDSSEWWKGTQCNHVVPRKFTCKDEIYKPPVDSCDGWLMYHIFVVNNRH